MNEIINKIHEIIKNRREELGLTVEQLIKKCCEVYYIDNTEEYTKYYNRYRSIINGETVLTTCNITAVATALGLNYLKLLSGEHIIQDDVDAEEKLREDNRFKNIATECGVEAHPRADELWELSKQCNDSDTDDIFRIMSVLLK